MQMPIQFVANVLLRLRPAPRIGPHSAELPVVYGPEPLHLSDSQLALLFEEAVSIGAPSHYDEAPRFALDYLRKSLFRKLDRREDEERLHSEAIERFFKVELKNRETNRHLKSGPCLHGVEGIISDARRKISELLGNFSWSAASQHFAWGPGATCSIKARLATLDNKMLEPTFSVTPHALAIARAYYDSSPLWLQGRCGYEVEGPFCSLEREWKTVPGGTFTTVRKDSGTRRGIDTQPTWNLFIQKGIGKLLRLAQKRVGIDLDSQLRNQELARRAWSENLATLDLSNASDCLSRELVRLLLPPDWYDAMDMVRTKSIEIEKGRYVLLEKFSSMGNGFTFELESLIFYALCWAVVRQEGKDAASPIAVYGDDIIVAQQHAPRVIEVLQEVGFDVNHGKSFVSGCFFESCGKHYFQGNDVTPAFQKDASWDVPTLIRLCNRLYRWGLRMGDGMYVDQTVRLAFEHVRWVTAHMHWEAEERRRIECLRRKRRWTRRLPPAQPYFMEQDVGVIRIACHDEATNSYRGYSFDPMSKVGQGEGLYAEAMRTWLVSRTAGYYWTGVSHTMTKLHGCVLPADMTDELPNERHLVMPRNEGVYTWKTGRSSWLGSSAWVPCWA